MTSLTIALETANKIRVAMASGETRLEVRDASGALLEVLILKGVLRPIDAPAPPQPPAISWEEMRRRAERRGGHTTADILADLDELENQR